MIPAEALTVDGNTVYLNGCPVAVVEGEPITAEQVTMLRNLVTTPKEDLMRNLNARLRGSVASSAATTSNGSGSGKGE